MSHIFLSEYSYAGEKTDNFHHEPSNAVPLSGFFRDLCLKGTVVVLLWQSRGGGGSEVTECRLSIT